jgi:tRNA A58 N-methylase Trm61
MIQPGKTNPQPLVLDIGAGTGALTTPLAREGWRVLAIENDSILAEKLRRRIGKAGTKNMQPVWGLHIFSCLLIFRQILVPSSFLLLHIPHRYN